MLGNCGNWDSGSAFSWNSSQCGFDINIQLQSETDLRCCIYQVQMGVAVTAKVYFEVTVTVRQSSQLTLSVVRDTFTVVVNRMVATQVRSWLHMQVRSRSQVQIPGSFDGVCDMRLGCFDAT